VLRHKNAVLRRQLTGPARYEPADRFWFAALSGLVDRVVTDDSGGPARRGLGDVVANGGPLRALSTKTGAKQKAAPNASAGELTRPWLRET
jgi:hypothetical protein